MARSNEGYEKTKQQTVTNCETETWELLVPGAFGGFRLWVRLQGYGCSEAYHSSSSVSQGS